MTVAQMRNAIYNAYPAPRWWRKVMDMADDQVVAVYFKLLNSGKLDPKPSNNDQNDIQKFKPFIGEQLSITF